jgi:hypothetical protein
MTNEEIKVEARNIAVKLGYGRSNPKWDTAVNAMVALGGRVREGDGVICDERAETHGASALAATSIRVKVDFHS